MVQTDFGWEGNSDVTEVIPYEDNPAYFDDDVDVTLTSDEEVESDANSDNMEEIEKMETIEFVAYIMQKLSAMPPEAAQECKEKILQHVKLLASIYNNESASKDMD